MTDNAQNPVIQQLQEVRAEALGQLHGIADLTALDAWRVHYLGRRGVLTQVMRGIGQLAPEQDCGGSLRQGRA